MSAINERWFGENDAIAEASGHSLKGTILERYGAGKATMVGGIVAPRRRDLAVGTRLVRYDGSSRPRVALGGKWWLEWSQYERLTLIARAASTGLNTVFRELCHVPPEWNNLHVVIQVRTVAPLAAYEGPGVPVDQIKPTLAVSNIIGDQPITQLYIPGLASYDIAQRALAIEGQGFQPGTTDA